MRVVRFHLGAPGFPQGTESGTAAEQPLRSVELQLVVAAGPRDRSGKRGESDEKPVRGVLPTEQLRVESCALDAWSSPPGPLLPASLFA